MPPADPRPRLHVMHGLPAAGKSTAARLLMASGARYVGLDALRWMLDAAPRQGSWPDGSESRTQRAEAALVAQLVADGADVVVDDTHVYPGQVAALVAAVRVPVRWVVHDLTHVPVDVCIRRDKNRQLPIGADVIRELWARHVEARATGWRLTAAWLEAQQACPTPDCEAA